MTSIPRSVIAFLAAPLLIAAPAPQAAAAPPARELLAPRFFPSWQAFDVCHPFVFRDPASGSYWMYYTGTGDDQLSDATSDQWATGLVTSADLRTWTGPDDYLPVLAPHRFLEGELTEAARTSEFDAMAAFAVSVLHDGARYRMWYTGWSGEDRHLGKGLFERVGHRIGLASSPDGRRWTKQRGDAGLGAVLAGGPGADALGVGRPAVLLEDSRYLMWYEGYDGATWRIFSAASSDGVRWLKRGVALGPGVAPALDADGARCPVVVRRGGRLELWYQGWSGGVSRVLRATSSDGLSWTRLPGAVALHPQPGVEKGDEIHVGSVLPAPDGSSLVFFAKQTLGPVGPKFGDVRRRSFRIYSERIAP
ncbi:MAG: hypothetical protein AB7O37_07720 [Vicinamibacteria bacterium]